MRSPRSAPGSGGESLFDADHHATASRWTFIVCKDGKIAYKNKNVLPADDTRKIAEFIAKADEK